MQKSLWRLWAKAMKRGHNYPRSKPGSRRSPRLVVDQLEDRIVLSGDGDSPLAADVLDSAVRNVSAMVEFAANPVGAITLLATTESARLLGEKGYTLPTLQTVSDHISGYMEGKRSEIIGDLKWSEVDVEHFDLLVGVAKTGLTAMPRLQLGASLGIHVAGEVDLGGILAGSLDTTYQWVKAGARRNYDESQGSLSPGQAIGQQFNYYVVTNASSLAEQLPAFKTFLRNNDSVGFEPDFGVSEFVSLAPAGSLERVTSILTQSTGLSRDEAVELAKGVLADFRAVMAAEIEQIVAANAEQLSIGLVETFRRATNPDPIEAERRMWHETIDKAYMLGTFASQMLQYVDPKLAQQFNTSIQAGSQIARSVTDLSALIRSGGVATDILGGAAAWAGIGGGVMQLVSMFGDFGPTANDGIIEELGALRQLIDQLRTEMHARFDRVDAALNALSQQIADGFHQLDLQNRQLRREIGSIQRDLGQVLSALDHLQDRTERMIQDADRREFITKAFASKHHQELFGRPMTLEEYQNYQIAFYIWGVDQAQTSLWAGTDLTDFRVDQIGPTLSDSVLASRLNYLAQLPTSSTLGHLPPLSSGLIVNPAEWFASAKAYIDLVKDSPQYAGTDLIVNKLIEAGRKIDQAVSMIAAVPDGSGGVAANRQLFEQLTARYRQTLEELDSAIRVAEQSYAAIEMRIPATGEILNPWLAASDQRTDWRPALDTWTSANGASSRTPDPDALRERLPRIYDLADRLGWGDIDVFLANLEILDWLPFPTRIVHTYHLRFGGTPVVEVKMDGIGHSLTEFTRTWTTTGTLAAADQAARERITQRLEALLQEDRRGIYTLIADSLQASSDIQKAASNLSGIRHLIESYLLFGLPQTVDSNDVIGTLFRGDEAIPGHGEFLEQYLALRSTPNSSHVRFDPIAFAEPRLTAFEAALESLLSGVPTGQTSVGIPEVRNVLRELEYVRSLYLSNRGDVAPAIDLGAGGIVRLAAKKNWSANGLLIDTNLADRSSEWVVTVNYGDGRTTVPVTVSRHPDSKLFFALPLSHTYRAKGTYLITVTLSSSESRFDPVTARLQVEVTAATPAATQLSGPASGVRAQQLTFRLAFPAFAPAGMTYAIDWGDGTTAQTLAAPLSDAMKFEHAFAASGRFTVRLTAIGAGQTGTEAAWPVTIYAAQKQGGTLAVGGTASDDAISFRRFQDAGVVDVWVNGARRGRFHGVSRVLAFGGDGDDHISVDTRMKGVKLVAGAFHETALTTMLFGGLGADSLQGGSGMNVLVGGPGFDVLVGGPSRDVLVGGFDGAHMIGSANEDLLLAGDIRPGSRVSDQAVLDYLLSRWTARVSYARRVTWLRDFLTGRMLPAPAGDVLVGGTGRDLFLCDLGSDLLTDRRFREMAIALENG